MNTVSADTPSLDQVLDHLRDPMKLNRDRGVAKLREIVSSLGPDGVAQLGHTFVALLEDEQQQPWEARHGALMGLGVLLAPGPSLAAADRGFATHLQTLVLHCLKDPEVRIRLEAGQVLGHMCQSLGIDVYVDCKDTLLDMIYNNLERNIQDDSVLTNAQVAEKEKLLEKFATHADQGVDAEQIFHDTAGWKALETSLKALQAVIDGCGSLFEPCITQELIDLIFQTLTHSNRFVRETGFYVCSSLVTCGQYEIEEDSIVTSLLSENNQLLTFGPQFSRYLGIGLSDNWSQVRLAAAVASRKFLLSLPLSVREAFYPELLPKLCLNRYYLAEGVRLYSQETWRLIVGNEGRSLVQKYIESVVNYYVSQTEANNHAVREAACSCIAELAVKLRTENVQPFVPQLLNCLLICFEDDSWPVRDAACLACGNFVLSFPKESRGSLERLYPLFFANLEDNIPSVRQGAAASVVNLIRAYGDEAANVIISKVEEGLRNIETQTAESEKYSELEKKPATFGVIKRLHDNDMDLHTNQTMYSCGSLAPKMGRRRDSWSDGCSRSFRRPAQPWELSDGCICLVGELASIQSVESFMPNLLNLVAQAATHRHFAHHVVVLETMCKQLPIMAKGVGKRVFKNHLEMFMEPLFYSLNSENALTAAAASDCLGQLASFLGPSIFRSRIEQFDPRFLRLYDANKPFST